MRRGKKGVRTQGELQASDVAQTQVHFLLLSVGTQMAQMTWASGFQEGGWTGEERC